MVKSGESHPFSAKQIPIFSETRLIWWLSPHFIWWFYTVSSVPIPILFDGYVHISPGGQRAPDLPALRPGAPAAAGGDRAQSLRGAVDFLSLGVALKIAGLCHGKSIYKWMKNGGTPILGNHHMCIYIYDGIYISVFSYFPEMTMRYRPYRQTRP